jgi:cell division protein FtsI (penicillin-binding protein 3)
MNKFFVLLIISLTFLGCKNADLLILNPNLEKELCENAYIDKSHINDKYTVTTFIDTTIQNTSKKALFGVLKQFEAESGFVMVMEANTGEIKAITSLTNDKLDNVSSNTIDALIPIEPGSLIKIFNLMCLLENKKADSSSVYNANGGEKIFYGLRIQDVKKGYKSLSLKRAFAVSSNVVFAQAIDNAFRDNPNQYINNYKNFGLYQDLDLPLNSKISSKIPTPKSDAWSKITLPWMGIGYGLSITPIQILSYYNFIGNNGVMVQPLFLSKISKEGSLKEYSTTILKNAICSKSTINLIQNLLKYSVSTDSKKLQIAGQAAEISIDYADPTKSKQVASTFVGYFSRNNSKYTMMVYIKKPKKQSVNHLNIAENLFGVIVNKIN